MGDRTRVSIAGSTGSIGTQALDVISASPGRFDVVALAAHSSVDLLCDQVSRFKPRTVVIVDEDKATEVRRRVPVGTRVMAGPEGLASMAGDADVVLNAIVGFAGLTVTLSTLEAGHRLALANKESLVAGGPVVQRAWTVSVGDIVPVDSEHCALHQCLQGCHGDAARNVRRLVLTASGGPFRGRRPQELAEVTAKDALAHPTWKMGPMNTVNSSTLMNKGLEVIEASLLFGVPYDRIDVVVHPQSVVHSMVEMVDGSTIAQLSLPDMRLPIGYALTYPERAEVPFGAIDWSSLGRLDFEPPDLEAFPCLELAYQAGRDGGTAPTCLNAANEVAVEAFLSGSLRWVDIPEVIAMTLATFVSTQPIDLDDVIEADIEARLLARHEVSKLSGRHPGLSGVTGR